MENEIWKTVPGYRETYSVSNYGNVKTLDRDGARGYKVRGRQLPQHKNSSGYYRVNINLSGKRKSVFVHRLVAECFVENPDNLGFVNHKDGDKLNNRSDNLEWCSRSDNELHAWRVGLKNRETVGTKGEKHGMHKLSQTDVNYIRNVHKPRHSKYGTKALAAHYGVTPQTITNVVSHKNWRGETADV